MRASAFVYPGDVGMVHQRQRLPLGLEAGDHLSGIHAGLDDFQRHLAADRMLLFGNEDQSHAAFADLLQGLVRTKTYPQNQYRHHGVYREITARVSR
jgi:hypothetical protein